MMNYLISRSALTLSLAVLLAACNGDDRGSGVLVTEDRTPAAAFDAVEVSNQFDVDIFEATSMSVEVTADDNLAEFVQVGVEGERLVVNLDKSGVKGASLTVRIGLPELRAITLSTSTDATVAGFASFDRLAVTLSTSARLELPAGTAAGLTVTASTSSALEAYALVAEEVVVDVGTSAEVEVTAAASLTGRVTTSGTVRYRGRPVVDVREETSGRVVDGN